MFYLQSQEKFKDADDSVKEGTIIIPGSNQTSQRSSKNAKKKSKTKRKPK